MVFFNVVLDVKSYVVAGKVCGSVFFKVCDLLFFSGGKYCWWGGGFSGFVVVCSQCL